MTTNSAVIRRRQYVNNGNATIKTTFDDNDDHSLPLSSSSSSPCSSSPCSSSPCSSSSCSSSQIFGFDAVDLLPGGVDKDVTLDNVEEYIDLMTDFCLNSGIKLQLDAFKGKFVFIILWIRTA